MLIYHVKRNKKEHIGYDEHSDYVVIAKDETEARAIGNAELYGDQGAIWSDRTRVDAVYLGKAKRGSKKGIVCKSYNAG